MRSLWRNRRKIFLAVVFLFLLLQMAAFGQPVNVVPDDELRACLNEKFFDKTGSALYDPITKEQLLGVQGHGVVLDCSGKGIESVEGMRYLIHVEFAQINMGENHIRDIGDFEKVSSAQFILKSNKIENYDVLSTNASIEKLNLQDNLVEVLNMATLPSNLQSLIASKNKISEIKGGSNYPPTLKQVELMGNNIYDISPLAQFAKATGNSLLAQDQQVDLFEILVKMGITDFTINQQVPRVLKGIMEKEVFFKETDWLRYASIPENMIIVGPYMKFFETYETSFEERHFLPKYSFNGTLSFRKSGVPKKVTDLKGERVSPTKAKFSWSPADGANFYEIWKHRSGNTYDLVASTTSTTIVLPVVPGVTGYYRVGAVNKDGQRIFKSELGNTVFLDVARPSPKSSSPYLWRCSIDLEAFCQCSGISCL